MDARRSGRVAWRRRGRVRPYSRVPTLGRPAAAAGAWAVSIYQDAEDVRVAGPARVLLGAYEGASSAIRAPSEINYLALRLAPGERWQYQPPAGHDVLWIAVGKGVVRVPDPVRRGELAIFAPGQEAVDFVAEAE